jgi:hypothetical protein
MSGLTTSEQVIMDELVRAWNLYEALTRVDNRHIGDIEQFRQAISTCQQMLAMRIVRREYPEYWI